jgi:cell cycle arrest protein BUB3
MAAAAAAAATQSEVKLHPSTDGISALRVEKSTGSRVLITSWDGAVTLYSLTTSEIVGRVETFSPVLCGTFASHDGQKAFAGGLDRVVNLWDIESGRSSMIALGTHENAVRCMEWCSALGSVVSGGWDACVRVWDPRQAQASKQAQSTTRVSAKVYAMDVHETNVALGLQDGTLKIYDLRRPDTAVVDRLSGLGHQIRCARFFDHGLGLLSGSIEGRVAVENTSPNVAQKRYSFKCHRDGDVVYPVNCIGTNPRSAVEFATGGGDGTVSVWDHKAKQRLYALNGLETSVSALEFSNDGTLLVVAQSYAFERGEVKDHPPDRVMVYMHERYLEEALGAEEDEEKDEA